MTTGQGLAPRYDIYGPVHKGLRFGHAGLMLRLGSADHEDRAASTAVIADLRRHLALGAAHLDHEEAHIHGVLDARVHGASSRPHAQHQVHHRRFAALDRLILALEAAPPGLRGTVGQQLYLAFTLFVAEDLEHMHEEETVTHPLLCAHFTDAELQAIEMAIIATLTPEMNLAYMRLMLPAMTPAERRALLSAMQQAAPAEALAAVMQHAARPSLSRRDYDDLAISLGIAA